MHLQSYTTSMAPASQLNLFSARLVHLYTASGAVAAFFGTIAVFDGRYRDAFLWMVLATAIDATDGTLARAARVKDVLPGIDGPKLDDIVDYLTFVFLPVLLVYHAGLLPAGWGPAVAAAVLVSSLFGFTATDAKTEDHFFTGFPSYWNIVSLYLYVAGLTAATNAAILLVLSALVFWRVRYVYPTRTPVWRRLTLSLGAIWAALVVVMIVMLPAVSTPIVLASLVFPIYYAGLSAVLHLRTRRGAGAASAARQ
jgi:phosphatidylcholine synthase